MSGRSRGEALIDSSAASVARICEMVVELTDPSAVKVGTVRELAVWVVQEGLTRFDVGAADPGHPDHRKAINDTRRGLTSRLKGWRKKGAAIPMLAGESSGAATMDVVFRHFGRVDDSDDGAE